jgi:hypothetical protein
MEDGMGTQLKKKAVANFQHHAKAYGIHAKFHWPVQEVIDANPSVDLPANGGFLKKSERDYDSNELVSFKRAYTEVSGSPNEELVNGHKVKAENNLSLAVIEGFDLLNVISVDKIVSRITTRYFHGSKEIEVVLIGTRFEGFRIAGHEVRIELETELHYAHPTYKAFTAAEAKFTKNGAAVANRPYTLVRNISAPQTTEFTVSGNVIEIPHIGKLYLAEMNVSPQAKILNMIRWELGCPTGGSGNIGGSEGGGSPPGQ